MLGQDWAETLAELAVEPTKELWQQAWRNWCQPRGLPVGEIESCHLEASDLRLLIRAPARLVERLQATRSDVLKGEAWLLAGQGRVRRAAVVQLLP